MMSAGALLFIVYGFLGQMDSCSADSYTNPVLNSNLPDPHALKLDSDQGFVAVATSDHATSAAGDSAFPLLVSKDFVNWEQVGFVFTPESWPKWAYCDMWAPEIHQVNGNFHVYFSGRKISDNELAIGVAISKNPLGPYKDYGKPIIETSPGVIDVHYFVDPKHKVPYLVWKVDYNAIQLPSKIFMQRVEPDGITLDPSSARYTLMRATATDDYLVVEGPTILYRCGYYYLFFSGNGFESPYYHVSVARSKSPTGPYERRDWAYFLHTDTDRYEDGKNSTFVGPGGGSAIQVSSHDDNDAYWYIYHSWRYDQIGVNPPGRVLNIDKMRWQDGWPHIGAPSDNPQPVPML